MAHTTSVSCLSHQNLMLWQSSLLQVVSQLLLHSPSSPSQHWHLIPSDSSTVTYPEISQQQHRKHHRNPSFMSFCNKHQWGDGFCAALTLLFGEGDWCSLCSSKGDVNQGGRDQEQQNQAVKPLQTHLLTSEASKEPATAPHYLYLASFTNLSYLVLVAFLSIMLFTIILLWSYPTCYIYIYI